MPPSFVVPGHEVTDEVIAIMKLLMAGEDTPDGMIRDSADLYVRQMLGTSALRLEIPRPFMPAPLTPRRFKDLLPRTASSRIRYVDRAGATWRAVEKYFEPILEDVNEIPRTAESKRSPRSFSRELASHFYSIALSSSQGAPAIVPPIPMAELLDIVEPFVRSSEARARISVLRGVSNCFQRQVDIPVLVCQPGIEASLSERISEILEDAYLLEASRLRTFFSPGENWASLRRDLRKVLSWVVENRAWAKSAVRLGEQVVSVPGQPGIIADAIAETGLAVRAESAPVLLENTHLAWKGGNTVLQVKFPGAIATFLP